MFSAKYSLAQAFLFLLHSTFFNARKGLEREKVLKALHLKISLKTKKRKYLLDNSFNFRKRYIDWSRKNRPAIKF